MSERDGPAGTERSAGLDAALPLLACPHCGQAISRQDAGVVGCALGHRFDVARQGYLSLLGKGSRTDTGDSADMVTARTDFLTGKHYEPLADAVADCVDVGPVLEVGAGTGYYLATALRNLRGRTGGVRTVGVALDSSRYAARRAAAADGMIGSVVADAWSRLPVRDGVVGTVLSVFAPRDPAEFTRVLMPGGRVVVVTPEPDHLAEIRSALSLLAVDAGKPERLTEAFAGRLETVGRQPLRQRMTLRPDDVDALVRMGPTARHLSPQELRAAVADLPATLPVTLSVTITTLMAG
ncbi:putative RNA methyltransferase [Nakamurella sp. GG22]